MKKKIMTIIMAAVLIIGCSVGVTLAWLKDSSGPITNTFTLGKVEIELEETTGGNDKVYKMVPGAEIQKDPIVTVETGSEDCWLFVKVEESQDLKQFIDYSIASGWNGLTGTSGVYYRKVLANDTEHSFNILDGNKVLVLDTVTKEMMSELDGNSIPSLTFTAYAIQLSGFEDNPAGAWDEVSR